MRRDGIFTMSMPTARRRTSTTNSGSWCGNSGPESGNSYQSS
jgi:hypothetical protein